MGIFFLAVFFCFFLILCMPDIPGSKPMYEEKLRVPLGVSLGTDLYLYSSLVWRARDKDASNDQARGTV